MTNEEIVCSDTGPTATKAAGTTDFMRTTYEAWASFDIDTLRSSWTDDVVFHVSGQHTLSGDRSGRGTD